MTPQTTNHKPQTTNHSSFTVSDGFRCMKIGLTKYPEIVLDHLIHHEKIYENPQHFCHKSHFGTVLQRFFIVTTAIPGMISFVVMGALISMAAAVKSAYNYFFHRNQNQLQDA